MTRGGLINKYFDWLYDTVCDGKYNKYLSYQRLLKALHNVEFTYTIDMDSNRAVDGTVLRYRFADEHGYSEEMAADYLDDTACSVLEMMVALSLRCEEHIMCNPDFGDRTGKWFWLMLTNLGLSSMSDSRFDEQLFDDAMDRLLNRDYKRNGEGGLFVNNKNRQDLRDVEIWYQMCWYLSDYNIT